MAPSPTGTWPNAGLAWRTSQVLEILHVNFEEPRARHGDPFHRVRPRAARVSDIHAKTHSRIHILYRFEDASEEWEILVLRTVVMYGHFDVVLFRQFLDDRQIFMPGSADHHREPDCLGVIEMFTQSCLIRLRQRDVTAPDHLQARLVEGFPSPPPVHPADRSAAGGILSHPHTRCSAPSRT